jgi:hypothetical protein
MESSLDLNPSIPEHDSATIPGGDGCYDTEPCQMFKSRKPPRGRHYGAQSRGGDLPVSEPPNVRPRRRRKRKLGVERSIFGVWPISFSSTLFLLSVVLSTVTPLAHAAFIHFDNCLPLDTQNSNPKRLQWVPYNFSASLNTSSPRFTLHTVIYGNVAGQLTEGNYPPPDSDVWSNPNDTFGKIVDIVPETNVYTTLFARTNALTFTPWEQPAEPFCSFLQNASCPLPPFFNVSGHDPYELPAIVLSHDFGGSWAFATLATTVTIKSGDKAGTLLGCISANITPELGNQISDALTYVPVAILALVAVATISAAIFSPWGSTNLFRWTSNYGRDEDLLRLVTPGFGDCLQYIQFIVLSGSLTLAYPGYYQPVVSRGSWATLMFNESFVSHGNGYEAINDGIYNVNVTYGLSRMSQYVGFTEDYDIWASMAVILLALTLCIVLLCQLGFLVRWISRTLSQTPEEDLRSKNLPFTAGNVIRLLLNYFLLPIVTLSMFQLVIANRSPGSVVACAVILLVGVIGGASWIFFIIFTTRPRAHLFDDLPTVILYGPLYNTYSDDAAPFAFIPVLLTVIRGIAIGAIQPSGIAQLVLLAICEVILILTLNAFRPFQASSSMNAYHTSFSAVRLVAVLLSVAFVPSLGVSEGPKGWIGYAILLLHGLVLFAFFMFALSKLIEVIARLCGAGRDTRGGLVRVFGKRQLSRRARSRGQLHRKQRSSLNSEAAMLATDADQKSVQLTDAARSRSMSASSGVLLNSLGQRHSAAFDQFSQGGDYSNQGGMSPGPGTPGGAASPHSFLPSVAGSAGPSSRRATMGLRSAENTDPYYRPPRQRRPTDPLAPGERSRESWGGGPPGQVPYRDNPEQMDGDDSWEGPSSLSHRGSITPAYFGRHRSDSDTNLPADGNRLNTTDYTIREADFYYGVQRGPALSDVPKRRLKTGPADPTGPVASAAGWVRGLFAGKKKDKGKGFEVIRSTRAPPQMMPLEEVSPPLDNEPYQDSPESQSGTFEGPRQIGAAVGGSRGEAGNLVQHLGSDDEQDDNDPFDSRVDNASDSPPMLAPIEPVGSIHIPSRMGSQISTHPGTTGPSRINTQRSVDSYVPTVPRKSSKRTGSRDGVPFLSDPSRLSTVAASPPDSPARNSLASQYLTAFQPMAGSTSSDPMRLPFTSSNNASANPSPSPDRPSDGPSTASSIYGGDGVRPVSENTGERLLSVPQHGPGVAGVGVDRPVSGFVQQHVAGEMVRPAIYGEHSNLGTQAEIVKVPSGGDSTHSGKSG